ncbi:SRPBCC family protein [Phenylobacterium sp.]|uniref:SRPBCC family protein n=1 Tax=Phenylobacterium sp. TaxID=1871053 RepID=UPI002721A815|nr:SRPBCC family protein [Phenylobacterium sp.]MDO8380418.1 SRPBCC family protein [Phenylobacterium sp.]
MSDAQLGPATFSREGPMVVATLSREIAADPQAVWAALTAPESLPQWLAPGTIELRPGGAVRLDFGDSGVVVDSTVSAVEPGRLLEYSWSGPGEPQRPVRWEIAPRGEAVDLTLTLKLPPEEDAGRSAAGWAAHLEMLACALAGVPIKFPFEAFKATRDAYRDVVGVKVDY